jgi:hypothetical protein
MIPNQASLVTLLLLLMAFAETSPAPRAQAADGLSSSRSQVEVPVRRVFFPSRGYDDNDNVQVVIEGELPDPCYVLGEQTVTRDPSGAITVHQFAWRRQGGACDTGDLLGETPFSEEVAIGRLKAGDYPVMYSPASGAAASRVLHIEKAAITTADNFNYARVNNLKTPDVVIEGQNAAITVTGPFGDSCNKLKDPVQVERVGDAFVIRPIELELGNCGFILRTYKKTINLGVLPAGEYLVHIRSRGGRAVEKTFYVIRAH